MFMFSDANELTDWFKMISKYASVVVVIFMVVSAMIIFLFLLIQNQENVKFGKHVCSNVQWNLSITTT